MKRVFLSIVLGLVTPFVFIMGASAFEVVGENSLKEFVGGSLAVALYLAFCQFCVAAKGSRGLGAKWPTMVAMTAPLLVAVALIALVERPNVLLVQGIPLLISGCFGILVGAVVAGRVTLPAMSLKFCRRALLTCAALLVAVALVVAAGVVPPVKADTFPLAAPQRAVHMFWGIVVLNFLAATDLVFLAIRATDRRGLSPAGLVLLAFLTFVLACFLTGPAFGFLKHGPAMQTACILLFFCSAAEFLAAVLLSTTALRLPSDERR